MFQVEICLKLFTSVHTKTWNELERTETTWNELEPLLTKWTQQQTDTKNKKFIRRNCVFNTIA